MRKSPGKKETIDNTQKNREYQQTRQKKLDELGANKVTARLGKDDYLMLARLCEDLGFPRPKPKQRNLVETYSNVITYLLQIEKMARRHRPQSKQAKELYRLHRTVSYQKYGNGATDEDIIDKMKQDKRRTPQAILEGEKRYDWSKKDIKNLLNEKALIKKLQQLDDSTNTSTSEKP